MVPLYYILCASGVRLLIVTQVKYGVLNYNWQIIKHCLFMTLFLQMVEDTIYNQILRKSEISQNNSLVNSIEDAYL